MTQPQITYRGLRHSPAMDARILELAAKLDEDAYVAISNAFDVMYRQLEDAARIQRGEVKHHRDDREGTALP